MRGRNPPLINQWWRPNVRLNLVNSGFTCCLLKCHNTYSKQSTRENHDWTSSGTYMPHSCVQTSQLEIGGPCSSPSQPLFSTQLQLTQIQKAEGKEIKHSKRPTFSATALWSLFLQTELNSTYQRLWEKNSGASWHIVRANTCLSKCADTGVSDLASLTHLAQVKV